MGTRKRSRRESELEKCFGRHLVFYRFRRLHFNLEAVKTKRKVLAPYTENGKPKDWEKSDRRKFSPDASVESLD